MKTTISVTVDVTNPDELLYTLGVLKQLGNVSAATSPPEGAAEEKPKVRRGRKTKAEKEAEAKAAEEKKAADDLAALTGGAPAEITLDMLKGAVTARAQRTTTAEVRKVFDDFGVPDLLKIAPENYGEFLAALNADQA